MNVCANIYVIWNRKFITVQLSTENTSCFNFFVYLFFILWPRVSTRGIAGNSLIPGCLWLWTFVLNNSLILGIWSSSIPHLPGHFCPWTFFQNIGFNMVPSDPFMSHLATQPGYSAGDRVSGFATDCPCDVWSTFWKSIFKHQLGCRFDILDSISSFLLYFDICNYICLDTSYQCLALF